MDSITQIVLGAACGEAVLGKKIGNKALLFGAIGGTIPDLDVFTSRLLYSNEIDIMAAHRGFSHSIVFSILGAFAFGYLVYWLYDRGKRKGTTTRHSWIKLCFWTLFTHIILDSFTPYGTQLFLPFSNYRVAFNNISVADPFYTVPFLLCMIVLMFYRRNTSRRRRWLKLGIGISSVYMLLTIVNKIYINSVFKDSFESSGIDYRRYSTQPTILNNILWYGIAETQNSYYIGFYSLLDKESSVRNMIEIKKNHNLVDLEHKDIATLAWFSNGYYNVASIPDNNHIQHNHLRSIMLSDSAEPQFVFSFAIYKNGERYDTKPYNGRPPSKEDFNAFLKRIKGN